jgi:soluble lytic murein transglycosylase-like protein
VLRTCLKIIAFLAMAGLAGPALAGGSAAPSGGPAEARAIVATVKRLAPAYGLDPALVTAVILAESGFVPNAVSPKNAKGLMQLMPETAMRFGVADPFDPAQNLNGGMSYLRWLFGRYAGNLGLTLAAYNAGEAAVEQYGGIPPYPETQDYVARVRRYYADVDLALAEVLSGAGGRGLPMVYRPNAAGAWERVSATGSFSIERTRAGVTIYRGRGPS